MTLPSNGIPVLRQAFQRLLGKAAPGAWRMSVSGDVKARHFGGEVRKSARLDERTRSLRRSARRARRAASAGRIQNGGSVNGGLGERSACRCSVAW